MPSTINADNGVSSGSAGLKSTADSSGVLQLQTNGTTAVTIDTSQNVGIGTSSPGSKLQVGDGTATPEVRVSGASTAGAGGFLRGYRGGSPSFYIGDLAPIAGGTVGGMTAYVYGANPFVFYTNGSETMRLDSSGNLGIGLVPVANNGILQLNSYGSVQALMEKATISATAATGTVNYDAATQAVLYYTTNASANWTLNIRGSSGLTLNNMMQTGQSLTVAFLVTQGATAYYASALTVDGASVTPKYQGGSAWTSGNASSIDAYVYTVVKTGSAAFTVFASQTQFK